MGETSHPAPDDTAAETEPRSESFVKRISRMPYATGLPEWSHFPSDAERLRVLDDIDRSMVPRSAKDFLVFLATVAVLMIVPWLVVGWVMAAVTPETVQTTRAYNWIRVGLMLILYTALVYLLIRRDVPKTLRKRLVELGVPVCRPCGYVLLGLPADRTRCPECGRALSARVRVLLQQPDDGKLL